jgi:hypothetical protein
VLHGAYTDICIKRLAEPRSLGITDRRILPAVPATLANQTHGLQRQTFKVYRVPGLGSTALTADHPRSPSKYPKSQNQMA